MDLETLATEYRSAEAEAEMQRRVYERARRAVSTAGSALIDAIIEAGLTEYGPITSSMEPSPFGLRRQWKPKVD